MAVVVLALLGALVAGRLTGGRVAHLGLLPLRRPVLVVAAVLAQVGGSLVPVPGAYPAGLVLSTVLAGAFLLLNRRLPGLGLVATGYVANTVAVLANHGRMPVSASALDRVGVAPADDGRHVLAGTGTALRWLTDVVPAPLPFGLGQVLSVGDVLVASGCALLVFAGVRCSAHGHQGTQAPRTQEEQGEPREAPERLTRSGRHRAGAGRPAP